ncbi:hypothetical protein JCM9140_4709 [Halalkalibacter wakoensis JCM 9140]|uniref:Uncharacterized protein n=1 Tax=Halalkalibacter wakoensis JCM 9140 TaxID=1236970 RepID=W4Q907_9BACI|nr:hypothetical protein [Halalkalibacter wakoensis]GAE28470.1 hypothetical protein JCM9140_4709 [Halalkalibacter wakoensis JCM 9140]
MKTINGQIIAGEFDFEANEFMLRKVKQHETVSIIKERQFFRLFHYLQDQQDCENQQVITLYDQMLIPLNQEEVKALVTDLKQIEPLYH